MNFENGDMRKVKNLIFDFDGTLVDTAPLIIKTMQATMHVLNLPLKDNTECLATIGLRLEDIAAVLWPDIPDLGERFTVTYRSIFDELKRPLNVVCFPKVTKTLKALHDAGFNMAVASSRNHKSLKEYLDLFGISKYFKILIGGDDVKRGKPAPDPVLAILKATGWNPEETLVIGDAGVDIIMGKAAGTQTCGVTYGYGRDAELKSEHPDYMIPKFDSLLTIVN